MPIYHEMRGEVSLRGTHVERKWVVLERAFPPGRLVAHWPPLGSRGQLRRSERTPVHAPQTDCLAPGAAGVCTGVQATTTATTLATTGRFATRVGRDPATAYKLYGTTPADNKVDTGLTQISAQP